MRIKGKLCGVVFVVNDRGISCKDPIIWLNLL